MDYYRSFDFKHTTTIDIPELGLLEQDVQMDVEMDSLLEEYRIHEVCIYDMCPATNSRNPVTIKDDKVIDAIIERFMSNPFEEEMMFEMAHYDLDGRW